MMAALRDARQTPASGCARNCKSRREGAGDRNLTPVLLEASQSVMPGPGCFRSPNPDQIVEHGKGTVAPVRNGEAA